MSASAKQAIREWGRARLRYLNGPGLFAEVEAAVEAIISELAQAERKSKRGKGKMLPAGLVGTCRWAPSPEGHWITACGRNWEFTHDGPKENRMDYCMGCGRPVAADTGGR